MLCLELFCLRRQARLGKTRKALTRDRARAGADLCFDFLELLGRGHSFAALPVPSNRTRSPSKRERVVVNVRMENLRLRSTHPCTRRVPGFGVSAGFAGLAGTWNE